MRIHLSLSVLVISSLSNVISSPLNENVSTSTSTTESSSTFSSTTPAYATSTVKNNLKSVQNNQEITVTLTKSPEESSQSESEESGIQHIIKHSKLFTEFVSFAVNPVIRADFVDKIRENLKVDETVVGNKENNESINKSPNPTIVITPLFTDNSSLRINSTSTSPSVTRPSSVAHDDLEAANTPSHPGLQQLFIELMNRSSPGFVVSFDYYTPKNNSKDEVDNSKTPIRVWGIIPDEQSNKTHYFLADHHNYITTETESKKTAKEQVDDFEFWKNDTLSHIDDKLGDGTIGSLLG